MDNNDIFKKLRVALMLRDEQIIEIMQLVDFRISKAELSAFFRSQDHPNFMECGDQVLRNFLNGLVIYLRGTKEDPKNPMEAISRNRENATPKATERFPRDINTKNAPTSKSFAGKKPSKPRSKNSDIKPDGKSPERRSADKKNAAASSKKTPKTQVVEKVRFNNGKNKK